MSAVFTAVGVGLAALAGPVAAETPLERGAYLVRNVAGCGNCHTKHDENGLPDGPELAGGDPLVASGAFIAHPPNLTPDPQTGLGKWSDDQLAKAIRECLRPDGSAIGPPMPCEMFRRISDNDLEAIVAYLRSVPAVNNVEPKSEYKNPPPKSYGPPVAAVADVARSDKVAYGEYLAGPLAHCVLCHTPTLPNSPRRDYAHALGAGGFKFEDAQGAVIASANITSDPDYGLGKWTDDEIKKGLTTGVDKFGAPAHPPMPWRLFAGMRADDLDAIVAYLRQLKPVAPR